MKDTHNKILVKVIRWGLRLHSIFHVVEFFSALYETAYLTAVIALIATIIEILASIYLPKEHVHFKGVINEVHENCKEDDFSDLDGTLNDGLDEIENWDEEHALDMVLNDMIKDIDENELDIPNKRILTYRRRDVSENSKTD